MRDLLRAKEIQRILILLVLLGAALPAMPDKPIDPWNLINPKKFLSVIFAIAMIQFISYVAAKAMGARIGILLSGTLGGLISSTAVFVTLSQKKKSSFLAVRLNSASATFASLGMLAEYLLIIFLTAPDLVNTILPPVVAMMIVGVGMAIALSTRGASQDSGQINQAMKPLKIRAIITLSLFILAMLLLASVIQSILGDEWLKAAVLVGSLFELHAVTYSTANLFALSQIRQPEVTEVLAIAVFGAFLSKFVILWIFDRGKFAAVTSVALLSMLLTGALTFCLN